MIGLAAGGGWAQDVVGEMQTYRTVYEDTLLDVARRFDLGFVEMRAANPDVDLWLPGAGTEVILSTAHLLPDAPRDGVVINLAEMRLYYFAEPNGVPQTHPVGIGRAGRLTPLGRTSIERKAADPAWYPPQSIRAEKPYLPAVVAPGPDNPLGEFALYLAWPAYLIHGTNNPWGIGRRVSSGCIRMYPEDIERLYGAIPIGAPVTVVDQPVKFGSIDGALYIEVHPSQSQADQLEIEGEFDHEIPSGILQLAEEKAAGLNVTVNWATVLRAAQERRGYPVRISR